MFLQVFSKCLSNIRQGYKFQTCKSTQLRQAQAYQTLPTSRRLLPKSIIWEQGYVACCSTLITHSQTLDQGGNIWQWH